MDQNKWIDLARAFLGKTDDKELIDISVLIKEKIKNNEWAFPLSIVHHIETMARIDERSRIELAKVMGEISCNYAILSYLYIDKMEFQNSLRKVHGFDLVDFSNQIVTQDFVRAAGLDGHNATIEGIKDEDLRKKFEIKLKEEMRTRNLFYELMQEPPDTEEITEWENDNEFYKQTLETIRQGIYQNKKEYRYIVRI
ncbi:hypothetical protein SPSIL_052360 [Sporomusa silvacetica DSM 10669]|uniref:DUF4375 domain-containing protein n=1 Tax=Sporomusa silvacetica DSM 10669 TaxID=1123289 RepID=A0ABZ3IU49_9FIRM|nr:hypothetical protein [Sporomusa silvacetica]OZC19673.1 hypothetical protein SPSIL_21030 [Sporomusa silvacetica DSM 10669]